MARIGRPPLGVTRKVSITLPASAWSDLERVHVLGPNGTEVTDRRSMSAVMREVIMSYLYGTIGDMEPED